MATAKMSLRRRIRLVRGCRLGAVGETSLIESSHRIRPGPSYDENRYDIGFVIAGAVVNNDASTAKFSANCDAQSSCGSGAKDSESEKKTTC